MRAGESPVYSETWRLGPRDPLVFGDGGPIPAFAPRTALTLPPQATVAGLVRTALMEAAVDLSEEAARRALAVRIRGPWLVADDVDAGGTAGLWVATPADVAVAGGELIRARLLRPGAGEGATLPSDAPAAFVDLPARCSAPEPKPGGQRLRGVKTSPLPFPLWPLDTVIAWGLEESPVPFPPKWELLASEGPHPIAPEPRIHVAIDLERQTALPEALFSSGGLRVADGFRFAVEVLGSDHAESPTVRPGLRVLGGESRTVACTVSPQPRFPGFERVEARIEAFLDRARGPLGLRVQLLTPGDFGGWRPRWPGSASVAIVAVAMDRHQAVSGWNLRGERPRAVRRLVPAGSVYYLGPFAGRDELLAICRALWGASLCEGAAGDPSTFVAPPAHDGYGLALPLPCSLTSEEP